MRCSSWRKQKMITILTLKIKKSKRKKKPNCVMDAGTAVSPLLTIDGASWPVGRPALLPSGVRPG